MLLLIPTVTPLQLVPALVARLNPPSPNLLTPVLLLLLAVASSSSSAALRPAQLRVRIFNLISNP
jgi:hypothetical protein